MLCGTRVCKTVYKTSDWQTKWQVVYYFREVIVLQENVFMKRKQFICEKGYIDMPANPVHIALYLTYLLESACSFHIVSGAKSRLCRKHRRICRMDGEAKNREERPIQH